MDMSAWVGREDSGSPSEWVKIPERCASRRSVFVVGVRNSRGSGVWIRGAKHACQGQRDAQLERALLDAAAEDLLDLAQPVADGVLVDLSRFAVRLRLDCSSR